MMLLIPIENSYICAEGHLTDESEQCPCGSRNLYSLARILDRVPVQESCHVMLQELPSLKCLLEN